MTSGKIIAQVRRIFVFDNIGSNLMLATKCCHACLAAYKSASKKCPQVAPFLVVMKDSS